MTKPRRGPARNVRDPVARAALSAFLREQRGHISPSTVGLRRPAAQASPGLTRSQVARLAGISAGWYAEIESGRAAGVSAATVAAIVHALGLDLAAEQHFRRLINAVMVSDARGRAKPSPASKGKNPSNIFGGKS